VDGIYAFCVDHFCVIVSVRPQRPAGDVHSLPLVADKERENQLTSFESFNLDARLLAGIIHSGYTTPTPIQAAAIPLALSGADLIGIAQTGTGKTAAFVLPILQKLLLSSTHGQTRALIITPTRELAEQIHETIRALSVKTKIKSATIYGGVAPAPQIRALRAGVEILVACPGRLLDHVRQRHAKLSSVEILVLDEADRMLDMGFLPAVTTILKEVSSQRQSLLFSATFAPEIAELAGQTMKNPQRIEVGLNRPVHTVTHAIFPVPAHLKSSLLTTLLARTTTESVLIFTRTKHRAERLAPQIEQAGHKVITLHSNKSQHQRQSAIKGFKGGQYQVMVATDIAARGIDVSTISHVINYDMPSTADAYIHRVGRTGRAEKTGDAFTLVTPEDNGMVKTIEKMMGQPLSRQILSSFDYTIPDTSGSAPHKQGDPSTRGRRGAAPARGAAHARGKASSGGDSKTRGAAPARGATPASGFRSRTGHTIGAGPQAPHKQSQGNRNRRPKPTDRPSGNV
jgi:ATP-dependent RNA helicase RhlE